MDEWEDLPTQRPFIFIYAFYVYESFSAYTSVHKDLASDSIIDICEPPGSAGNWT